MGRTLKLTRQQRPAYFWKLKYKVFVVCAKEPPFSCSLQIRILFSLHETQFLRPICIAMDDLHDHGSSSYIVKGILCTHMNESREFIFIFFLSNANFIVLKFNFMNHRQLHHCHLPSQCHRHPSQTHCCHRSLIQDPLCGL